MFRWTIYESHSSRYSPEHVTVQNENTNLHVLRILDVIPCPLPYRRDIPTQKRVDILVFKSTSSCESALISRVLRGNRWLLALKISQQGQTRHSTCGVYRCFSRNARNASRSRVRGASMLSRGHPLTHPGALLCSDWSN